MNNKRIRDWGVAIGSMPTGRLNKITDVPGVKVGHATIDTEFHKTGLTVIIPAPGNLFTHKLTAATHIVNGFGKTCGTVQVDELGTLETPIALTSTLCVGRVADAVVGYTLEQCAADGVDVCSVNPVVGETNDATFNRAADRAVGEKELREALAAACDDFDEGDVGAGKGTTCLGVKGGIGSASRLITLNDGKTYTLGALLQTNFGRLDDLTIAGAPVGMDIRRILERGPAEPDQGSCMMVIGTDLPLSELQLKRVLRHAVVGLARVGSYVGHGSGDVVLGFTTANRHEPSESHLRPMTALSDSAIDAAFRAAVECVEESVLNSIACADSVTGSDGRNVNTLHGLPEFLPELKSIYWPDAQAPAADAGEKA